MTRWDFRTLLSKTVNGARFARRASDMIQRMTSRAGRALCVGSPFATASEGLQNLEERRLLDGDFGSAVLIAIDGTTLRGSASGDIDPNVATSDNDFYQFVAPSAGFVSVLADTRNEATPSTLNTRVTVYNAAQTQIASGANNGVLTSGTAKDGWAGFVATAGETYFVVVSRDGAGTGGYTLQVNTENVGFSVEDTDGIVAGFAGIGRELNSPIPDGLFVPITPIMGTLLSLQQDIVYKYVVPDRKEFGSLVTVNAQVTTAANDRPRLDSRLDIYQASGTSGAVNRLSFDSDAGRLNDAFATFRAEPNQVYYIRIRSDEVNPGREDFGTGTFFLVLDGVATDLPINRVTRRGSTADAFTGFGDPTNQPPAPFPEVDPPVFQVNAHVFESQGNGLTITNATGAGLDPVIDPAMALFDDAGTRIGFNDNFAGNAPQLEIQLQGGNSYFILVDGFDINGGTQYQLFNESNHTFDATQPNDDHINTPTSTGENRLRDFAKATPIVWGGPQHSFDAANGNLIRDIGMRVSGTGEGRNQANGDTDVFKFTAPVNMLGTYGGDNDDAGSSMFVGGAFTRAGASLVYPTVSRGLAVWDANDYWYTGDQRWNDNFGVQFGFSDNLATPTEGAVIRALFDWDTDPAGDGGAPAGMTDHVVVVAGDFTLTIPGPPGQPPIVVQNIALWVQNWNTGEFGWSNALGSLDGPVHAALVVDEPAPAGGGPDPDPYLIVGGEFTDGAAIFVPGLGFAGIGLPADSSVFALAAYDPGDPGNGQTESDDPPLPGIVDPVDPTLQVYLGGGFSGTDDRNLDFQNIASFSLANGVVRSIFEGAGVDPADPPGNSFPGAAGFGIIDGPVFSLTTFDDPAWDPTVDDEEVARVLIIGGEFTNAGGNAVSNLTAFGYPLDSLTAELDPLPPTEQFLRWDVDAMDGGVNGPVFTMTTWDPPEINETPDDQTRILVVGGEFDDRDTNIDTYDGQAWDPGFFGDGTDAPVRTLATALDTQEPNIADDLRGGTDNQEVIYVGGDFDFVFPGAPNPPLRVNKLAQWSAFHDTVNNVDFFSWSALQGGVGVDVEADFGPTTGLDVQDPPEFVPSVNALLFFDDGNPLRFDRHDRPSSRLDLVVNNAFGAQPIITNLQVRVYDSQGAIVYDLGRQGAEDRDPLNNPVDDPGMWDPSVLSPGELQRLNQFLGIPVWGGETYYVEIIRQGTGRYTVSATVDANPTDLNGDGVFDHVNGSYTDESSEGSFSEAIDINTQLPTGDGSNYVTASAQPFRGNGTRGYAIAPKDRIVNTWSSDLGIISTIDDTDLYAFRAEFTGTAEVRIQTRAIATESGEDVLRINAAGQTVAEVVNGSTKTIRSSLDSALRVFNNDFVQVGYNDDNYALRSDFSATNVGVTNAEFTRKDAVFVFNVVAGNLYYVQVESGQFYEDGSSEDRSARVPSVTREVDWGSALGAYQLHINQMSLQLNDVINGVEVQDDHDDTVPDPGAAAPLATIIAMGQLGDGAGNGVGTITGRILNMFTSPEVPAGSGVRRDTDVFSVTASGAGTMTIRVTPTSGNLLPDVQAFFPSESGGIIQPDGSVLLTLSDLFAGERYFLRVRGAGGTEGAYRIDVNSQPAVDDHGDQGKWADASDLVLRDFLGTGNGSGSIEVPGDSDVFRFQVQTYSTLTLNVTGVDAAFNPIVEVFEVSEDPRGNPLYLRIGQNDDANAGTTNSRVRFPVGPDRIVDVVPAGEGPEDREYPYYYIVVRSADPLAGQGRYSLNIQFTQTDDFADGDSDLDGNFDTGEYDFAHQINIDPVTGAGAITGNIELSNDSDLFSFIPTASGIATLIVSGTNGSVVRPRISLLDANANPILDANGDPITSTADDSAAFNLAFITADLDRGVQYFVVIDSFEDPLNPNIETSRTGRYSLSLTTPPLDDYPNIREWDLAHTILLSNQDGNGRVGGTSLGDPSNARISPTNDTDLFTFVTINAGTHSIVAQSYSAVTGRFGARVRVFDATRALVSDTSATAVGATVTTTLPGLTVGARYFVLVSPLPGLVGSTDTGEYSLLIDGPVPDVPPPPPDPSNIDFDDATLLVLDGRTGDARASSIIEVTGDRDLFKFTPLASGKTFIQLVKPTGSTLSASLRVLSGRDANEGADNTWVDADGNNIEVRFDSAGIPGAISNIEFEAVAGQTYWIIVDGLGDSTGGYTLYVNTIPTLNRLYFPEGFSTSSIREFVSVVNPNSVDVSYTVRLKYENASIPDTVLAGNRILANSRDGLTLVNLDFYQSPGLVLNQPYSVVIESSAPLGATLAHYDFGTSIGDSFTETVARRWDFAQVARRPGEDLDFIIFHNPAAFDILVTLTMYQSGQSPVAVTGRYGADRRGGFALVDFLTDYNTGAVVTIPTGDFSVTLTAAPVDSANNAAFDGVVASLSHYNLPAGTGYAVLGDPDGGALEGAVTNVIRGQNANSQVTFFNPSDLPATLSVRGSYIRSSSLPQFGRALQVPARGQLIVTGETLGLVADQPAGLTYTSDIPVSVTFATTQNGDADGVTASDQAGTKFFFGDAFIDADNAGTLYFETLFIHNPSSIATTLTINLLFFDGSNETYSLDLAANGFSEFRMHELTAIKDQRNGYQWFAVDASSPTPVVMSMTHYDLFLGGGWATQGTPFGLLNDLSKIS
ncbi:MAG: hypothetical protein ACOYN0_00145 [Phycisphaerales bacterium]